MNVKQGDLAIVVRTAPESHNLGKLCKVLRQRAPGDFPGFNNTGPAWIVEAIGSPFSVSTNGRITSFATVRPIRDHCLRPISGLPDTESTDEQLIKPVENLVSAA